MQVIKEFRYAVEGIRPTTFTIGMDAKKLPPDVLAFAERSGLLSKSVEASPENKERHTDEETKGRKKKGR